MGMNSYFYSFDQGNLYRHNTNTVRNNYYGEQFISSVTVLTPTVGKDKLSKDPKPLADLNLKSNNVFSFLI